MVGVFAVLCPGQGAQQPGLLTPWLELDGAAALLTQWSQAAGLDLIEHGTVSDAATIRDTAIAQPLIVAASLLSYHFLDPAIKTAVSVVAGHSVGEFAAAAVAGVMSDVEAITLVAQRGRAMAACAAQSETGMAAVIGGSPADVVAAITAAGAEPANYNGAGQIVAAGPVAALEVLAANPPAGTRVVRLAVAGAFHTVTMAPAAAELAKAAGSIVPENPTKIFLSNADGVGLFDGQVILANLVRQVTLPVRWDLCMAALGHLELTGAIELAPAKVLSGLLKRDLKSLPSYNLSTPANLAAITITNHEENH